MKECLYPVGEFSHEDIRPFYDGENRTYDIDGIVKEFKDITTVTRLYSNGHTKEEKVFVLDNIFRINDGVYILSHLTEVIRWEKERFDPTKENVQKAFELFKEHDGKIYIAGAYETFVCLLLNKLPIGIINHDDRIGSGFNYGSTNVLPSVGGKILILAEND